MKRILGIMCILGSASCFVDVALIAKQSRLMTEHGWGLPSPFTFSLLAAAFIMVCVFAAKDKG